MRHDDVLDVVLFLIWNESLRSFLRYYYGMVLIIKELYCTVKARSITTRDDGIMAWEKQKYRFIVQSQNKINTTNANAATTKRKSEEEKEEEEEEEEIQQSRIYHTIIFISMFHTHDPRKSRSS